MVSRVCNAATASVVIVAVQLIDLCAVIINGPDQTVHASQSQSLFSRRNAASSHAMLFVHHHHPVQHGIRNMVVSCLERLSLLIHLLFHFYS